MVVKESPKSMSATLKDTARELSQILGEQLLSLVLYGQSAKELNPRKSEDLQLVIVLKTVTAALLQSIGEPLSKAWQRFNVQPYIVTEDELARLADVFPLRIWSMQKHGQTLHGEAIVDKIEIEREHLRLRVEQQLRNLQVRIRRRLLSTGHDPRLIIPLIFQLSSNIHTPLEVMLHLKDKSIEALERDDLFRRASDIFALDTQVLDRFKSPHMCSPAEVESLGEDAIQLLSKLAEIADTLEV